MNNWFINGLVAATLLGVYNFLYGLIRKDVNISSILAGIGLGLILTSLVYSLFQKKFVYTLTSNWWLTVIIGATLGLAIIFVVRAFADPKTQVSQLVPLININTLFSVILGLVILREYQSVSLLKVFLGTAFILIGAFVIK